MSLTKRNELRYRLAGAELGRALVVCSPSLLKLSRLEPMDGSEVVLSDCNSKFLVRSCDRSGFSPMQRPGESSSLDRANSDFGFESNLVWCGESITGAAKFLENSPFQFDSLVVGLDFPQQIRNAELAVLHENQPFSQRFVLLGPLCQGATRTDLPFPDFERVFWHTMSDWLVCENAMQVRQDNAEGAGRSIQNLGTTFAESTCGEKSSRVLNQPKLNSTGQWVPEWTEWFLSHAEDSHAEDRSANRLRVSDEPSAEIGLHDSKAVSAGRPGNSASQRSERGKLKQKAELLESRKQSCWIFSATRETYWSLAEALEVIGWEAKWLRELPSGGEPGAELILVDCEFGLAPQKKLVQELAQLKLPIVVIVGFPCPDDSAWIGELPGVVLVDKPYWLGQIRQVAQRLFST